MSETQSSLVPAGALLGGKFRVTRELGRGGMAVVYEAENVDIGKKVAVKILAAELITSRIVRERFLREARAAAAIRSPYICDVYDSGMFEERPFLVMELLEGETLYEMMTRVRRFDVPSTLRIATQAAKGLQKAHDANIVHRDLKPENIFLTKDEEGELLAKIVDFGLAKFYEPLSGETENVRLTREGALFGTPAYMSPEQAKAKGEVDHRSDLWALGCIVYECLTGHTVWAIDNGVAMILAQIASGPLPLPSKLRPDLPRAFDRWFQKALARETAERFQSARELADELNRAFAEPVPESRRNAEDMGPASARAPQATSPEPVYQAPSPLAASVDLRPQAPPSPRPRRNYHFLGWSAFVLGACALAGAGYLHWTKQKLPLFGLGKGNATDTPAAPNSNVNYAEELARAQQLLAQKNPEEALKAFKNAYQVGSKVPATRSLLSHAAVAAEETKGPCKVSGLGRPRPLEIDEAASRPVAVLTPQGTVLAWHDNHEDPKRRQLYTVLMDAALRRQGSATPVTPEAVAVRQPRLLRAGNQLVLTYGESGGTEPGLYARKLDGSGKPVGPGKRFAETRKDDSVPNITPIQAGAGRYFAVWHDDEKGKSDVFLRELDGDLTPLGAPVRIAALAGSIPAQAPPDIAFGNGHLHLTFGLARAQDKQQLYVLSVALSDPSLRTGVTRAAGAEADRFVGKLEALASGAGRRVAPHIGCFSEGCLVAWEDDKSGAQVAFFSKSLKLEWQRELARRGTRPGLATSADGGFIAWYEESRLRGATFSAKGINPSTILSRINGFQLEPDISPGANASQWYLTFRDYEAAHLEAFVVRTDCE